MSRKEQLNRLYEEYIKEFNGSEIVTGDGNTHAKLLLVGEAPGKDEVKLSKPFVGAAGKNLSEFLETLGVERDDIFITNAIKFRLSKINPVTGRSVNRPATKEEIESNKRFLYEEIKIISPKFIVTLGNIPLKAVTGSGKIKIGDIHGTVLQTQIWGQQFNVFPLYHPASIIYNRSLKDVYINDLEKLKKVMDSI